MSNTNLLAFTITSLFLLTGCSGENPASHSVSENQLTLDSINTANNNSVEDAGYLTKGFIDEENNSFYIVADIKKDHRIFGYERPDIHSKKLILFSVFTDDVDGNPFSLPLGAYYDTQELEVGSVFKYLSHVDGFVELEFTSPQEKKLIYIEDNWVSSPENELKNDDDALEEYGTIEHIEDGPYPYFVVTVFFPKSNHRVGFDLDIESIDLDDVGLRACLNKTVQVHYTSEFENNLEDIKMNNASLLGDYAPDFDASWKSITGTLSGASSLSGDRVSSIYVQDKDGIKMEFSIYVESEIKAANGKEVTVFYTKSIANTIVGIGTNDN